MYLIFGKVPSFSFELLRAAGYASCAARTCEVGHLVGEAG